MTQTDYRPEAILDQAAESERGVIVIFTSIKARNSFRTRLYRALDKITALELSPWDDLVIRDPGMDQGGWRIWIGRASAEGFGIIEVKEVRG